MQPGVYLSASNICLWKLYIVLFLLPAFEDTSVHFSTSPSAEHFLFLFQGPPCPHCSTSPLGQCWLGRGHRNWNFCSLFLPSVLTPVPPLVCSFHSVVFKLFFFFQRSFVWSYFVLQFDNPWYQYNFSSIALVHQEWTQPSLHVFFSSFILVCLFQWMFPHSLFFCQNFCPSLILNLSIFFHLAVFVFNDAPFLLHRELFHE